MSEYADIEPNIIELQFDIVPVIEGKIAYDTLHGYDNFHININVEEKDFRKNKDKILNEFCYNILHSYQIPNNVKEADIILLLDRNTRRVLRIINNGYVKKSELLEELEELRFIDNIDYLQFKLKNILESGKTRYE